MIRAERSPNSVLRRSLIGTVILVSRVFAKRLGNDEKVRALPAKSDAKKKALRPAGGALADCEALLGVVGRFRQCEWCLGAF